MSETAQIFDHVVIIMFENQYRQYVMENPYFRKLAGQGVDLANCFGVMHPSQTNYISSIAGELCNVTYDSRPDPPLAQKNVVDLIEAAGLTWKAYMDGYAPGLSPWSPSLVPADQYPYVIKHDPFSSFVDVLTSEERWQRIVSESQFWTDLRDGNLPNYAWFTPDMWNDGHYIRGTQQEPKRRAPALVDQAADWLEWFFGTLSFPGPDSILPPRTLVVVNFDEADFEAAWDAGEKYTYDGPNQIYTVLLGDVVKPGTVEEEGYNHYSVLRTIEESFGLGTLEKNDADSNWLRFLWDERFAWGAAEPTPIRSTGALTAASLGDVLYVVYAAADSLVFRTWDGTSWSDEQPVGLPATDKAALACLGETLYLACRTAEGSIAVSTFRSGAWSASQDVLVPGPAGDFDLASCNRGADLMLAWAGAGGEISSRRFQAGAWGEPVDTGHPTDGSVALCSLGHCLLLVCKVVDSDGMNAVSYNTADFNVTTVAASSYSGPWDDAVQDAWSPSAHPVAHFAAASSPVTPKEPEPRLSPYAAGSPLAMAELGGVVHLVHPAVSAGTLCTECFSIAGLLTPKNKVSYRASDEKTTSNGYGTLAEAGWSLQEDVPGVRQRSGGALAVARCAGEVVLLTEPGGELPVRMCVGKYGQKS